MFLNQLNQNEKEAFMSLSVHVANANGILANEEKEMIQEYCREMGIDSFDEKDIASMDNVLAVFEQSDLRIKIIVLLEILGLAYADGEYEDSEDNFVMRFAAELGLNKNTVKEQKDLLVEYLEILKKIVHSIS